MEPAPGGTQAAARAGGGMMPGGMTMQQYQLYQQPYLCQ
jgi:hypothetical protein